MSAALDVVFSSGRRRTPAALLLAAVVIGVGMSLLWPTVRGLDRAAIGQTSGITFDMSVNLAWCRRYPYVTSRVPQINLTEVDVSKVGSQTIRGLIEDSVGSMDAYCRIDAAATAIHEMSIVLLEYPLLRLHPGMTVSGLAYCLQFAAVAALFVFAFALLKVGWPLLFTGAVTMTALYLTVLLGGNFLYSQYPLILPIALAEIGGGALLLVYGAHRRTWSFAAGAFALGLWAGFLGNFRTSLYPTAVIVGALFVAFGLADGTLQESRTKSRSLLVGCAMTLMLAAGIFTFDRMWLAPQRVQAPAGYTYHTLAHPLVLGLASPPSALAAREHIEWDDGSGATIAKAVDPSVTFLGPGYERALFTFYRRLWLTYPWEMMDIYRRKLAVTRTSADDFLALDQSSDFWKVKDGRWLPIAAWPGATAARAVGVLGLLAALLLAGYLRPSFLAIDAPKAFVVMSLGIAGMIGFIESAMVLSGVVAWYSSVYVFVYVFAGLVLYQFGLDSCRAAVQRWRAPR